MWLTFNRKAEDTCWSLRSSTWQHYAASDKLWYLTIEFYGKWQKVAIHNETPYLISQFHNLKKINHNDNSYSSNLSHLDYHNCQISGITMATYKVVANLEGVLPG